LLNKIISSKDEKISSFWIFIDSLTSSETKSLGAGNIATLRKAAEILSKIGVQEASILPITSRARGIASSFSNDSAYAIDPSILNLYQVSEIKQNNTFMNIIDRISLELPDSPVSHADYQRAINISIMREAYETLSVLLRTHKVFSERTIAFENFKKENQHWLPQYATFNALKKEHKDLPWYQWEDKDNYRNFNSSQIQDFIEQNSYEVDFWMYIQFELSLQVKDFNNYAKTDLNLETETFVGVGISRDSAEGLFMSELYDDSMQIGCYPEPENGYPLQLWGFISPIPGSKYDDYNAGRYNYLKSLGFDKIVGDHGAGMFGGYTTFPFEITEKLLLTVDPEKSRFPELFKTLANRKFVNAGDYPAATEALGKWAFNPGDEENRHLNAINVMKEFIKKGIVPIVETVGDYNRRIAAEMAVAFAASQGFHIETMRAIPWESSHLNMFLGLDRLALTHDMPSFSNILTDKRGPHELGQSIDNISGLVQRLRVPLTKADLPLREENLSASLFRIMYTNLFRGSTAGVVSMPFASLFNTLPKHANNGLYQNANVLPGTGGEFDNPMRNWINRMPALEYLYEDNHMETLRTILDRNNPILSDGYQSLYDDGHFQAIGSKITKPTDVPVLITESNKNLFPHHNIGEFAFWPIHKILEKEICIEGVEDSLSLSLVPIYELIVSNLNKSKDETSWKTIQLNEAGIRADKDYVFLDIRNNEAYVKNGLQLLNEGLTVGLNGNSKRHTHHFVVFEIQ